MNYCKCNCGSEVRGIWKQGHNLRVKNPMAGKLSWNHGRVGQMSDEQRAKIRAARLRQVFSAESQRKKSQSLKLAYLEGRRRVEDLAFYIDGRHNGKKPIKQSYEYKVWRKAVFERDDYTCKDCGMRGGELQADHIQPQSLFPELRFDLENGRTLCRPCHMKTTTWGKRVWNKKKTTTSIFVGTQT